MALFFARSSRGKRNYMIWANLAVIRRKWAKVGPFYPKKSGPFFGFRRSKTCFSASGMEISQGVCLRTGIRPSMKNLHPISSRRLRHSEDGLACAGHKLKGGALVDFAFILFSRAWGFLG